MDWVVIYVQKSDKGVLQSGGMGGFCRCVEGTCKEAKMITNHDDTD